MKANNIKKAWELAENIIPTDYNKNETLSERAGYPIYEGINGDYICDLGSRLEVNLITGETINIWIEEGELTREYKSGEELQQIANEIAETIVIRTYVNGCSRDERRTTTEPEREILRKIARTALSSMNYGEKMRASKELTQAVIDTAEFALINFIPEANAYDSIYIPLTRVVAKWPRVSL